MSDIVNNRKALHDYHILDRYEAGLELKGTEVKSIRAGKVNLSDAYARVENGQVTLYNSDIQPYEKASHGDHSNNSISFRAPVRHSRFPTYTYEKPIARSSYPYRR